MKPPDEGKPDRFLTAKEVGELIGFSVKAIWKGEGELAALTPIRIGKRSVRYSYLKVMEWMEAQKRKADLERQSVPATTNNIVEFVPTRKRQPNAQRQRAKVIRLAVLSRSNGNEHD